MFLQGFLLFLNCVLQDALKGVMVRDEIDVVLVVCLRGVIAGHATMCLAVVL